MFGFACKETLDLMLMPIYLAHKLTDRLAKMRQRQDAPSVPRRQSEARIRGDTMEAGKATVVVDPA